MPWTLYRYFAKDLLKVLALTTAVLVVLMSFGAAIKPLTDGLLTPTSLFRFVFYSAPTFLGFVLPFAGAFAASLVFNRIAADNELVACCASGISYRSILLPVAALGVALTMGLFYLSNWVVPRFYAATAGVIEEDITRAIVKSIQKRQPVVLDEANSVLYADRAWEEAVAPPDPDADAGADPDERILPQRRVVLERMVFAQQDESGDLQSDFTAERADVFLYQHDMQRFALIMLRNFTHYDASAGQFDARAAQVRELALPPIRLRSPLRDNPKFMSLPELRRLTSQPDQFDRVRELKRSLAQAIAAERIAHAIGSVLDESGPAILQGPRRTEQYRLTAPNWRRTATGIRLNGSPADPVRVEYVYRDELARVITADSATLTIEPGELGGEPLIAVQLDDAMVQDVRIAGPASEKAELNLPRCRWPQPMATDLLSRASLAELKAMAEDPAIAEGRAVKLALFDLHKEGVKLARRILAQLHERAASAIACPLLLLLGAVLAMRMRGTQSLVVFFWSCVLAFVTVIIINAGKHMVEDGGMTTVIPGLALLWSGNVLLAVVAGAVYCLVARN